MQLLVALVGWVRLAAAVQKWVVVGCAQALVAGLRVGSYCLLVAAGEGVVVLLAAR